jgi:(p)ppGpp synthase/HD superfamily hydrolase
MEDAAGCAATMVRQARTSTMLPERFDDAMVFASKLHREQVREGPDVPYIAHLLAVASLVIEHGGGED